MGAPAFDPDRVPLERGWLAPTVREQQPGLELRYAIVPGGRRRSPRALRARLAELAQRLGGPQAVQLRHRDVPWAYRLAFHRLGLDPDRERTPVEGLALARLVRGGLPSSGLPRDAVVLAIAETGVALRALAADGMVGAPGLRVAAPGEELAGRPGALRPGEVVIADERAPLALPFGPAARDHEVGRRTRATLLCALRVQGVPEATVEEALWLALGTLAES